MARGDAARKAAWSAYVKGKLNELKITPAALSRLTGISDKTIYNWTLGVSIASAETCLILAAAFGVAAAEALRAGGYDLLADAMEGKELRLVDVPTDKPDPGLMKILAAKDLTDEVKAVMIRWWKERLADDEARRIADAKRLIEMQQNSA